MSTLPVVTNVTATPFNADLKQGSLVVLQVRTSAPVNVTRGVPTLTLNDGGFAVYDAASSTPTLLTFKNTVKAGENTPDLAVTAANLNNALIVDSAGQELDLDGAIGNPAGILQIDTIRPTIFSAIETGSLQPGGTFFITFNFSEAVVISGGTPTFPLSNGGIAHRSLPLSTPTSAVFTYRIQPGDDTNNLQLGVFNPNGAIAVDAAGNILDETSVMPALVNATGTVSNVGEGGLALTIAVSRFFNAKNGTHFYTQDPAERASILSTRPDLVLEDPGGDGMTAVDPRSADPNAVEVYRFFDSKQGTHFFTADKAERDTVIGTRPDLFFEPAGSLYEHLMPQVGDTAVYRFFDTKFGTHFYTDDLTERASILQNRPDLVAEGIGFYEPARNTGM